MTKILLHGFSFILININICVNCNEVTDNQNQEQQTNNQQNNIENINNNETLISMQNQTQQNGNSNNQIQNNNTESTMNLLLQKINKIELELQKNNAIIQEQQNIIKQQKKQETEKINKVFNELQNTKIVAVQHSDGTTTITDRNQINNVPRKSFPQHNTTMLPTNIITPTL